ncbi:hypothetical protein ACHWQZ_G015816 [Mnemiopsis leidyi]
MTYLDLLSQGQRLCQLNKFEDALPVLEKALYKVGSDKGKLRIVYSYLGNVHYSLGNYGRAMEYHRQDLKITQNLGDIDGQTEALNNLSCALRMLGKFSEAALAADKQLALAELNKNKKSEASARYNAGVVAYMQGRQIATESEDQINAYNCFMRAQDHLQDYLLLGEDLKDIKMQGQACGCLGNVYYLLGNYSKALFYYRKRLLLAQKNGDQVAQRRAYSNLALCHALLGQFEEASEYWKKFLSVAIEQGDTAAQGQAYYCLGNNNSIMGNYQKAAEYYNRHLCIAQKLGDRVGEGRAFWMLSNVFSNSGQLNKALDNARKFYDLATEMEDNVASAAAKMMINDIGNFLGVEIGPEGEYQENVDKSEFARQRRNSCTTTSPRPPRVQVPDNNWVSEPRVHEPLSEEPGLGNLKPKSKNLSNTNMSQSVRTVQTAQTGQTNFSHFSGTSLNEDFFELLHKHMANRYDDQRAPLPIVKEESPASPPPSNPAYPPVSQIRGYHNTPVRPKPKRFNRDEGVDQHAPLRTFSQMPPISQNLLKTNTRVAPNSEIWTQLHSNKLRGAPSEVSVTESEESFFQLISRMQGNRLDDQRCSIPLGLGL